MKHLFGQKPKVPYRTHTGHEFTVKIGLEKDAPYGVAFSAGDLFTTMEPEQAEALAEQFVQAARACRIQRMAKTPVGLPPRG